MKKIIVLIALLLIAYSCQQLWSVNERGFSEYMREQLAARHVQFSSLKCSGSVRSRVGFCAFRSNKEELEKFAKLISKNEEQASALYYVKNNLMPFHSNDGCLSPNAPDGLRGFDTSTEFHNEKGEFESYMTIISKEAKVYEPVPPFEHDQSRNIRPRNNLLISDSAGENVCLELEYPYG